MRQRFTLLSKTMLLLCALLAGSASAWADETSGSESLTWREQGLSNQTSIDGTAYNLGDYFTVTCTKNGAGTAPTYYDSGSAVRCYATKNTSNGNQITVALKESVTETVYITQVVYNGTHSKKGTTSFSYSGNPLTTGATYATYDSDDEVTTASATLCETGGSSNGQFYFTSVTVEYVVVTSGSATATATTINVPEGFNTDINTSTTAGTLTATVTPEGESALDNPAITWRSSNTDVATIDENSGAVTLVAVGTTTITASYAGVTDEYAASSSDPYELVVTSSAPATLPFAYDGGGTGTLPQGFSVHELGSSYDESPKMKFDDTGDWAILKIGEEPGKLSFDIKGNDFSNGTFKVQESEDGTNYSDLATYTEFEGTTQSKVLYPDADTRYIKWIYTEKVTGNVALGNIRLLGVQAYGYTLNVTGEDADAMAELSVDDSPLDENDEIVYGSEVTVTVVTTDGYSYAISVKDANNNDVTVTNDKFIMPNSTVTVTVTTSINRTATATLTGSDMSEMSEAGQGYGVYKSIVKDGLTWGTNGYQTSTLTTMIQLRTRTHNSGVSYIQLPTFSGNIQTITMSVTSAGANEEGGERANTTLYFQTDDSSTGTVIASGGGSNTNEIVIDLSQLTDKYSTGYITVYGNGVRIWNITVIYEPEVKVTISDANYATFYNRWFAVNFTSTGIKAYTAEDGETSVTLNEITSGKVPAQTPVVLYKAGGCTDLNVPVIASATAISGTNDLKVSTGEKPTNAYVLAKPTNKEVGFYLWDSSLRLNEGKVYLQAASSARAFLGFGEATGIADVNNGNFCSENTYDLQGRRVAQPQKGLYIVNGKKVIIK